MAMTTPALPKQFRALPPEPWGRRLGRAREDVAGLTLAQAAQLAGYWMLTSDVTISRLERLAEAPHGPRQTGRRQLAYVLCLCYEVDPAQFDLGPEDLPPGIHVTPRSHDEQGVPSSTIWYPHRPSVTALRPAA